MNASKEIWLMNTYQEELSVPMMDINPPRIVRFPHLKPLPFPREIGLKYSNVYKTLKVCDNPKDFLEGRKINHLIVRDAGIGDLILMEPCFRELAAMDREITLITHFSKLFTEHPAIAHVIQMQNKNDFDARMVNRFDLSNDMRNSSETHNHRAEWHRTDIYESIMGINLGDREPRIYMNFDERPLKKEKGLNYIGFQFDASENYRRFPTPRAREIIEHFLSRDEKNIAVLLGNRKYIDFEHPRVIDFQNKTDLRQAMAVIYNLDFMFAADSGLLHAALAMHIPTLAWFSIISPDLRLRYYTGRKSILKPSVTCHPCGNFHAGGCQHGNAESDPDYRVPVFMAPCSKFEPELVYDQLIEMGASDAPRVYRENGGLNER